MGQLEDGIPVCVSGKHPRKTHLEGRISHSGTVLVPPKTSYTGCLGRPYDLDDLFASVIVEVFSFSPAYILVNFSKGIIGGQYRSKA